MNKLTVAALALAALGLVSTAASAATVTPGANDLILGFQQSGVSTDLEVDLGNSSLFTSTSSFTLSQLSVSDLNAIFTSGWTSSVSWSVAGVSAAGNNSFFLTSTDDPSTVSTNTSSGLGGAKGLISQLSTGGNTQGSLNGATSTANSSSSAAIGGGATPAGSLAQSYTSLEQGNGYTYEADAEQTGAGSLELFNFSAGVKSGGFFPPATDLGSFSLSSTGVLTWNGIDATATPEPSSYALGVCAALLFWVLKRRRSIA